MSGADPQDPTGLDGRSAPPRANGELVFTAPWQSRLFATTMALREREAIEWEQFRQSLISAIAEHEQTLDGLDDERFDYWGCWQRALEHLLTGTGVVTAGAVATRAAEFAARPAGHDHGHDHHHGHGHGHGHDHSHEHGHSH